MWNLSNASDESIGCGSLAKKFVPSGSGFLVLVERRTLARVFGIAQWDYTLSKAQYQICDKFDPAPIAKARGLTPSKLGSAAPHCCVRFSATAWSPLAG